MMPMHMVTNEWQRQRDPENVIKYLKDDPINDENVLLD